MSDFYEISAALQDKYEYLKYRMLLSMFDEKPREYTPDWSWDLRKPGWMGDAMPDEVKDYRETLEEAIDSGNQGNVPGHAQVAFNDLITQIKELTFDFNRPLDFIVFEALFYKLITDAYMYQRYSGQSEQLISIEKAKAILDDDQYVYISLIYEILQLEFNWWMNYRDNFDGNGFLKNTKAYRAGIHLTRVESQIGTKEYWNEIKKLASNAHDIFPTGELANRIMLISDVQLIYGVGDWKDVFDPANEELMKYRDIRKDQYGNATFIIDCFSDEFEDYCKPLGWITGLPHLEERNTPHIAASKCTNEEENRQFLESCYQEIMLFPSSIYIPNSAALVLSGLAGIKENSSPQESAIADAVNKRIISENNRLKEEKKSIINSFSHTYKNMRATSLLEVANALLATGDENLMRHGRTLLLEYSTKQTLTKDVELLQLRFEDENDKLQKKIRESMYSSSSSFEPLGIERLISDAFKRCLITLFHDVKYGNAMRKGFREAANCSLKLKTLCERFEREALFESDVDVFEWFVKNMIPIKSDFSSSWKKLQFEKDNYAAVMITGLLAELTANMFKYADKSKNISYSFDETEDRLIISIKNNIATRIERSADGGKGLIATSETFRLLNKAGNINEEAINTDIESNGVFITTVVLSKAIFEPSL